MLRGPSGGGKTTLLNLLGTIDKPSSGTLELFGKKIDSTSTDNFLSNLRLAKIGFQLSFYQIFTLRFRVSNFQLVSNYVSL
jgi:putative ABC transport system ATP-binding protein